VSRPDKTSWQLEHNRAGAYRTSTMCGQKAMVWQLLLQQPKLITSAEMFHNITENHKLV
jgi:hypothetical protein